MGSWFGTPSQTSLSGSCPSRKAGNRLTRTKTSIAGTQTAERAAVLDTSKQLTDVLAERVMGWRLAPVTYIKSDRGWIPKWRFQPLVRIEDAFQLLEAATNSYRLEAREDGTFTAEIYTGTRSGMASGPSKARTITHALAFALQIEFPNESAGGNSIPTRRGLVSKSRVDAR